MAMSMAGGMAAMGHAMAGDEILKDSLANYAFEHYEIAAYKSLITLARTAGASDALPRCSRILIKRWPWPNGLTRTWKR